MPDGPASLISARRPAVPRPVRRLAIAAIVTCLAVLLFAAEAPAFKGDIGYNTLVTEFGDAVPNGSGVVVSQVEAKSDNAYLPDASNPDFDGKTISNGGGNGSGTSTHATGMGLFFYGNGNSVAGGVTQVTVYESDFYMNNILKLSSMLTPILQTFKVQNHSWIGSFSSTGTETNVLQRLDYVIDVQDMIAVVGMDNMSSHNMSVFPLLNSGYNSIAVGRSSGGHATGATALPAYGPGRQKPDVVAPADSVSRSTAITSSVAAALYESGSGTNAVRSETMKAIILAGATKEEFPTWSRTTTKPLDDTFGAGEVNILNSYLIQRGGESNGSSTQPTSTIGNFGWDYGIAEPDSALYYNFTAREFFDVSLSAVLAWNVEIFDTNAGAQFFPDERLVNLNLKLYDSSSTFLGSLVDQSVSSIDNVEHIYQTDLAPGTYSLQITNLDDEDARDFGLAWRLTSLPTYRAQGDYNGNGVVDAGDYSVWRNTLGSVVNLQADGDLDGVVDQDDYDVWVSGYGTSFLVGAGGSAATALVPEPHSLSLAALALFAALASSRRHRS